MGNSPSERGEAGHTTAITKRPPGPVRQLTAGISSPHEIDIHSRRPNAAADVLWDVVCNDRPR